MATVMLARPSGRRLLPTPDRELYEPSTDNNPLWQALAAFSDTSSLPAWRRLTGRHGKSATGVRHLLHLHRLAFASELAGQYRQADFFWRETHHELRKLWKQTSTWNEAASALGAAFSGSGDALRSLLALELVLDVHLAFANGDWRDANGEQRDTGAGPRAIAHAGWIGGILDLSQPPVADVATVLLPLIEDRANQLMEGKRLDDAVAWLSAHPACSAPHLVERVAQLHFEATLARLGPDPSDTELEQARILEAGIAQLEDLLRQHPACLPAYDFLAHLQHMRSVCLANGGKAADAMVASAMASAYDPSHGPALEAMKQLNDLMNALRKQMADVRQQLSTQPGATLNAEGLALQRQADAGFIPLEKFRNSGEPERIAAARRVASAANVWREIQVGSTSSRLSDAQLLALLTLVTAVFESEANDIASLTELARDKIEESEGLPAVDAAAVARFVLRRRNENGESAESPGAPDSAASSGPAFAIPSATLASKDREPFLYWMAGSQDTGDRVLVATAAACAVVVTLGSAIEIPSRHVRDDAVQAIRSARGPDAIEVTISAAERFLRAPSLPGPDPRRAEVTAAYSRALTTWFAALDGPAAAAVRARIDTYRSLVGTRGEQP